MLVTTIRRTSFLLPMAVGMVIASPACAQSSDGPHGPIYLARVSPMDVTVRTRIMPQMEKLLQQLLRERHAMSLGGVKVFDAGDKFLPGKIAMAMAYRISLLDAGDPRRDQMLKDFGNIAALTIGDPNEGWGIYYYVSALRSLDQLGVLHQAVPAPLLAKLRDKLDWRRFVRPDLTLINLPNNYIGVAFSIAKLRQLLGWEDGAAASALLARTLAHYRKYSGAFGFADETDGEGRFDRYSVLLVGEIAQRLIETDTPIPPEVKPWLRHSVDLLLPRFNLNGEGFEYGRSIGVYGETAFLEVLTAAARLKILTPTEERMAYAMSSRIAARYMDFWVDFTTGSVDMWDKGRRTDAYRGKHRIFGENLSLARQFIYTNAIWNELGYRERLPDAGYARWLETLPKATTIWFAKGQYDRALVTVRDGGHVIGLPMINGADGQHMNNPYFPVPFSTGLLQGAADTRYPQLTPRITLTDGSVLMPLAYFRNISVTRTSGVTEVRWRQDMLDRLGGEKPVPDKRLAIETRYRFLPGRIERSDRLIPAARVEIKRIDVEFASFSSAARPAGAGGVAFGKGEVRGFAADGYGRCLAGMPDSADYAAPTGPFSTVVRCGREVGAGGAMSLAWTLNYGPRNYVQKASRAPARRAR